jgi:hypothetical protein
MVAPVCVEERELVMVVAMQGSPDAAASRRR